MVATGLLGVKILPAHMVFMLNRPSLHGYSSNYGKNGSHFFLLNKSLEAFVLTTLRIFFLIFRPEMGQKRF